MWSEDVGSGCRVRMWGKDSGWGCGVRIQGKDVEWGCGVRCGVRMWGQDVESGCEETAKKWAWLFGLDSIVVWSGLVRLGFVSHKKVATVCEQRHSLVTRGLPTSHVASGIKGGFLKNDSVEGRQMEAEMSDFRLVCGCGSVYLCVRAAGQHWSCAQTLSTPFFLRKSHPSQVPWKHCKDFMVVWGLGGR